MLFFRVILICMKSYYRYHIDDFFITIMESDGFITDVWGDRSDGSPAPPVPKKETPAIRKMKEELEAYFSGTLTSFTTPIALRGTPFQRRVYHALIEIPFGSTASYKEIAERVGSPKGFRAVGQAVHNNPHLIIVPCHRIIGSDKSLTGFAGGLDMKRHLLEIEGAL